jgi:hypothetical protein
MGVPPGRGCGSGGCAWRLFAGAVSIEEKGCGLLGYVGVSRFGLAYGGAALAFRVSVGGIEGPQVAGW